MKCDKEIHGEWIAWQWQKIQPKRASVSKNSATSFYTKLYSFSETLNKKRKKKTAQSTDRAVEGGQTEGGARSTGLRRSSRNRKAATGSSQSSPPMLFSGLNLEDL